MQRREFLAAAGTAGMAAATFSAVQGDDASTRREFVELRRFTVKDADKKKQWVDILDKAFIPALNAQGIKPVGVFVTREEVRQGEEAYQNEVFVVIPHKTVESFLTLTPKLLADETFRKNAAPLFETTSKDPVYRTCSSSLLYGFESCPVLETPKLGPDRVFQWRSYRSFNVERHAAKIHMFDHGGELALFRKVGLNPIFFGDTIFGQKMPNLTYMIGCENREIHDAAWKSFIDDPQWAAIRDDPRYADTATEIDRVVLKPSPGSQI